MNTFLRCLQHEIISAQLECLAGTTVMPNCMYRSSEIDFLFLIYARNLFCDTVWKGNEYDEWLVQ